MDCDGADVVNLPPKNLLHRYNHVAKYLFYNLIYPFCVITERISCL